MLVDLKTLVVIEVLLAIGLALYRACLTDRHRSVVDGRAVAITLLTPAVALLGHNLYAYLAYLAIAVWVSATRPADRCSLYLLMLPMTPELTMFAGAGSVYLLALSAVVAMNVGALIAALTVRTRRPITSPAIDAGVVLLIALFVYIDARDVSAIALARGTITTVLAFAAPYLLVSRSIASREQLDRALLRLALAGFLVAVVALFQTTRHWVLYQHFYEALHIPVPLQSATLAIRGGRLRTGGPLVDYSVAGVFFATIVMTLPYLKSAFRPGRFWGVALVMIAGLFVTQSRGAWVGAAVGFAAILVYRRQIVRAVLLGVTAVLLRFVLFLSISADSGLAQTVGKAASSEGTVDYRRNLLSRGLEQVAAHPLFGQQPKDLINNLEDLRQGQHIVDFVNSHLYIAMVGGLLGFAVWLMVWLTPLVMAWRARRGTVVGYSPAEVPFGMLVASMTALAATSTVDRNLTWPTIALALTAPCVSFAAGRRRAAAGRPVKNPDQSGSAGDGVLTPA